ncbi:MAG: FKBP-type peptidyl-prolyl cis-trans isomerase [Planctomycetaceae bacterium]|nr:FKBP-type peptidyl-prolyl cis-trans isomerase [Planctomycetaceae bacterium]
MSRRSLTTGVLLFLAGLVGFAIGTVSPGTAQESKPPSAGDAQLKTLEDKAAYAIGLNIGKGLLSDELSVNPDLVAKGLVDALKKSKPLLTEDQIVATMTEFSKAMQAKATAKNKVAADKGAALLAENKKKKGVTTTESGLQYEVITAGKGASPKKTDKVKVHYHGTLVDGKVFDSSVERKEPASFAVNEVIPGWTEALQLMKVGDKWRLHIPPDLAYRDRGTPGGPIPPNAVLIFDVELLEIQKSAP